MKVTEHQAGEKEEDRDTARLVESAQRGDRDAFTALYTRYFDRVYAYLRVLLRDSHEAEDAAQHVFAQAFEALPGYEPRRPFRAWLFTIARNRGMDIYRRRERVEVLEPRAIDRCLDDEEPPPELPILDWITDRDLLLFVERLPLAQRQALLMRYVLDFDNGEIATAMGRSPDDVRKLHHRALRFLETRLTSIGREPPHGGRVRMHRWRKQATVIRRRRFALMR